MARIAKGENTGVFRYYTSCTSVRTFVLQGIQDRLAEVINFGAFTSQGGQAGKRAGAAKQGEADVHEGRTGRPAATRA